MLVIASTRLTIFISTPPEVQVCAYYLRHTLAAVTTSLYPLTPSTLRRVLSFTPLVLVLIF